MRTDHEIAVARHMAAAHAGNFPVTPYQRALLHGMKVALGLNMFIMPKDRNSWTLLIQKVCESYNPTNYTEFVHRIPRSVTPKSEAEWSEFRQVTIQAEQFYEMPPLHKGIVQGMRIATAWVLQLATGGRALEDLYMGAQTEQAIPFRCVPEDITKLVGK